MQPQIHHSTTSRILPKAAGVTLHLWTGIVGWYPGRSLCYNPQSLYKVAYKYQEIMKYFELQMWLVMYSHPVDCILYKPL